MDKNTKNGDLIKRVIYIVTAIVAVIVAQVIADNLLDGSFAWTLAIMVILLLIFVPIGSFIDKKIDAHYENEKNQLLTSKCARAFSSDNIPLAPKSIFLK